MREITSHKVNGVNEALKIEVQDEPGAGGACHRYMVSFDNPAVDNHYLIAFQNGPIAEAGVNGLTQEALLAIVADRLECFQAGPYRCVQNGVALEHVRTAMEALQHRTRERAARGVEGTSTI